MAGGFFGLVDFVGYPVGQGVGSPHAPKYGGKRFAYLQALMQEQEERSLMEQRALQALHQRMQEGIFKKWEEFEAERQRILWGNAITTILAEV